VRRGGLGTFVWNAVGICGWPGDAETIQPVISTLDVGAFWVDSEWVWATTYNGGGLIRWGPNEGAQQVGENLTFPSGVTTQDSVAYIAESHGGVLGVVVKISFGGGENPEMRVLAQSLNGLKDLVAAQPSGDLYALEPGTGCIVRIDPDSGLWERTWRGFGTLRSMVAIGDCLYVLETLSESRSFSSLSANLARREGARGRVWRLPLAGSERELILKGVGNALTLGQPVDTQ